MPPSVLVSERRKQGNDWHNHEYDGQCYGNCYFFHGFGVFEFNAHLFSPFKIEMIKSIRILDKNAVRIVTRRYRIW